MKASMPLWQLRERLKEAGEFADNRCPVDQKIMDKAREHIGFLTDTLADLLNEGLQHLAQLQFAATRSGDAGRWEDGQMTAEHYEAMLGAIVNGRSGKQTGKPNGRKR